MPPLGLCILSTKKSIMAYAAIKAGDWSATFSSTLTTEVESFSTLSSPSIAMTFA